MKAYENSYEFHNFMTAQGDGTAVISAKPTVDDAFQTFSRIDFLPSNEQKNARIDGPLSIGHGQTNSQPSTVRQMLEWLDIQPGDKVLDIGSGSGWTTALSSHLTGLFGMVYAVERIPALLKFGRNNCERLGVTNARFFRAERGVCGLPQYASYDRILVSAEASTIPMELITQLEPFGKMVVPVGGNVLEITRMFEDEYETIIHPGYVFVPLK
jgi:protein-L-isoaspartate(D-aspartate) O-methyltransferase